MKNSNLICVHCKKKREEHSITTELCPDRMKHFKKNTINPDAQEQQNKIDRLSRMVLFSDRPPKVKSQLVEDMATEIAKLKNILYNKFVKDYYQTKTK